MHELLDVRQVARRLDLPESTIRSWILKRRIQFVRLGRSVRIPATAVEELIQNGTVAPSKRDTGEDHV